MHPVDAAFAQWPEPPTTPAEALAHTLDMYHDSPDQDMVIIATSGMYMDGPQRIRTGITWGDLRALRNLIADVDGPRAKDI